MCKVSRLSINSRYLNEVKGPSALLLGWYRAEPRPFWRRGFLFCPQVQTIKGGLR